MSAEQFRWQDVPEPPELIAQTEAAKKDRAHNETRCADCDRPRWAHGWKASELTQACRFVEPTS